MSMTLLATFFLLNNFYTMTEYWVSKKQYWCKYCSIYIRDDAPSRKLHETGLKHQGNKERYIRDLYKSGNQAKREKAAEAAQIARIEASAEAAYAHDAHASSSRIRLHPTATFAPPSASRKTDKPKDKWANYTSAKDLGFDDEDTQKSSYQIEQELKGRAGEVGAWEDVVEAAPGHTLQATRSLAHSNADSDDEGEGFKFSHREKRPWHDVYDEGEWDPKAALSSLKLKKQDKSDGVKMEEQNGLDRKGWDGKIELQGHHLSSVKAQPEDKHETLDAEPDVKPEIPAAENAGSSLFKKRRPVQHRQK
ncbi:hypothetical protein BD324DRAFT_625114 [Kockovaella imperatae]|uniref:Matrin-type domain-containing protein n=1 Tax=Kockovaella imperatae TaxID=4999 RepID=A0A1Y1UI25_9TREE|nr:hypothetical protein BD324DRAFT_625114 [Kockovaella imperatae]ORX37187.1 hypothetical protein BD324DRAFT_625114 [Kockovaella imperatae]